QETRSIPGCYAHCLSGPNSTGKALWSRSGVEGSVDTGLPVSLFLTATGRDFGGRFMPTVRMQAYIATGRHDADIIRKNTSLFSPPGTHTACIFVSFKSTMVYQVSSP